MCKKLLVWSGGLDSTSILLDHAEKRIPIDTIYISLENNEVKSKREIEARSKIKEILKTEFFYNFEDHEIKINALRFDGNSSLSILSQAPIWILSLLGFGKTREYDEILFGYVRGDDFWHYKHNFIKAFKYLWLCDSKIPELKYPLEWNFKDTLLPVYKTNHVFEKIFDLITTCESNGDEDNCGNCDPCKKLFKLREQFKEVINHDVTYTESQFKKEVNSECNQIEALMSDVDITDKVTISETFKYNINPIK